MKLYKNLQTALTERDQVRALKLDLQSEKFPPELFFFPDLEELYLEGLCRDFPRIGSPWHRLRVLSIKWPSFAGDLSQIFSLPALENFKLIETPIKKLLLPLGSVNRTLRSLTIKNCGLEDLPEEISTLTALSEMNLSQNKLEKLPHSFADLRELRRLNLDANQFSQFPDHVKTMKNLGHLSIDQNPFPQEEKDRIQREFHIWL